MPQSTLIFFIVFLTIIVIYFLYKYVFPRYIRLFLSRTFILKFSYLIKKIFTKKNILVCFLTGLIGIIIRIILYKLGLNLTPDLDNFTFFGFTVGLPFIGLTIRQIVTIYLEGFDSRIPAGKLNGDIPKNKDINLSLPTRSYSSSNRPGSSGGESDTSSVPSLYSNHDNHVNSFPHIRHLPHVQRPDQCNPDDYDRVGASVNDPIMHVSSFIIDKKIQEWCGSAVPVV
jgi:hypothetical protein